MRPYSKFAKIAAVFVTLAAGVLPLLHGLGFMAGFNTGPNAELAGRHTTPTPAPPVTSAPDSPSGRVVVVIVDGLRADKLPLLGLDLPARCTLETVMPSYSRPAYVALSTGVPPTLSGVHTNDHSGPARLESIWDVARAAGRPTHLVTDGIDWWVDLFPAAFTTSDIVKKLDFPAWVEHAAPFAPGEVTLVHIVAVDDDGHDFGALSTQYDTSARAAGQAIRTLASRLDLAGADTLIVTADHGHIDRGGHGGPEDVVMHVALVASGHGIRADLPPAANDATCNGKLVDLPATVAALLGVPPPAANIGQPLAILSHPLVVPSAFPPLAAPAVRGASWIGLGLALLAVALAIAFALRGRREQRAVTLVGAAMAWPLVATLVYVIFEPTLSLSAAWDEDPWTLHIIAVLLPPALVTGLVVFLRVLRDPWRGLYVWSAGMLLPVAIAAGVHGALAAGPELGEPHAAFGLIVGDLIAAFGAVSALIALGVRSLRDRRRRGREPATTTRDATPQTVSNNTAAS